MNLHVLDKGSKPDWARASSCIFPSLSVNAVNIKNESQSGVDSLKAPNILGASSDPD